MVIDQLESGTDLNKILNLLRKRFGVDLRLHESTKDEVEQILEHYENVKRTIALAESFNTTISHPEYAKAILICEACRLFLHEIAPARKNAKVRTKKQQKAEKTIDGSVTEDISPELQIGKDFEDAGTCFDGEDHTRDYRADRNPANPKSFSFDYTKDDSAVFVKDESPETLPIDTEKSFEVVSKDDESGVVARYSVHRNLNPDDYADDRDPRSITPEPESSNPMDALRARSDADNPETKTGLDPSLETGMTIEKPKFVGSGIRKNMKKGSSNPTQREIPDPNDLQAGNKQFYNNGHVNEASLALAWINKINDKKYYNKILEAADAVATERDKDIIHILNAVETYGHRYANSKNDEYTLAMVEALNMLGDVSDLNIIMEARSSGDKHRKLFNKLLNNCRQFNLTEGQKKRFVYAAHNALFQTNLVKHNIL